MPSSHLLTFVLTAGALCAQQSLTVPAAFDGDDAPSRLWVAGVTSSFRQQVVIDSAHLQAMANHSITAILWRREAAQEVYQGGSSGLRVQLAESANAPLSASTVFADNLGPAPTLAFDGTVTLPTAPAMGTSGLVWDSTNTLRVDLTTPHAYAGGHLVLDLVGTAHSPSVPWWPLDAVWDNTSGTAVDVGAACGPFANAQGTSAGASAGSLLAGGSAHLWSRGPENGFAFLFLSLVPPGLPGAPLDSLLAGADPACSVYLSAPAALMVEAYDYVPVPGSWARADHFLRLPNEGWLFGATFHTQWLDLTSMATSNATSCTVAAAAPTLGMVTISGNAGAASGVMMPHIAHVLRFEYQ